MNGKMKKQYIAPQTDVTFTECCDMICVSVVVDGGAAENGITTGDGRLLLDWALEDVE